ncbi:HAD family hydrolase [Halobacteriales archaeon QH_10_67_22]|nr:MAG: HAD family hydrolase [Halobacteriales archaeon QH_10_67_22]
MTAGVIVDLDGTVYRSGDPIPGAVDAIRRMRDRGIGVLFCSNNPTKTPAEYVDRLGAMGIEVTERDVLPASTVLREYLRATHAGEPTYLVGAPSLADYLRAAGQHVVDHPADASVFVASWDDTFDYETMARVLAGVDEETTFLGSDPDRTIPTADGFTPGSGAIIAAVAGTIGRDPDRVLGKPSEEAASAALDRLGVAPAECLVVGDRLDTDLAMGVAQGMQTALVLTGVAGPADLETSDVDPDYVLDSLADLPEVLD